MTTTLYRAYDEAGVLLYAGITNDLPRRKAAHASENRHWYGHAARWEAEDYLSREDAKVAEARAIQREGPIFNTAGRSDYESANAAWTAYVDKAAS